MAYSPTVESQKKSRKNDSIKTIWWSEQHQADTQSATETTRLSSSFSHLSWKVFFVRCSFKLSISYSVYAQKKQQPMNFK